MDSARSFTCMGLMVAAVAGFGRDTGSERFPQSRPRPAPRRTVKMSVDLLKPTGAALRPATAIAGSSLTVAITAKPDARPSWRFGFAGRALAAGSIATDADGRGRLTVVLPEVRHRTTCTLLLAAESGKVSREVVVFPSSLLSHNARRLAEHRLGVADARGLLHRALREEKVAAEDLNPKLAMDHFRGGIVLLGGYKQPAVLAGVVGRLLGRVRQGLCVVVLNPPAGWRGGGLACVEPPKPHIGRIEPAEAMWANVLAADFGAGPWRRVLKVDQPAEALMWIAGGEGKEGKGKGPASRPARGALLVAARRVGRGWLVAAALPQLDDPAGNAVGRMILDEMVLWVLKQRIEIRKGEEQRS